MLGTMIAVCVCGSSLEARAQAMNSVCSAETVRGPLPLVYQSPTVLYDGRVQFRICLLCAAAVKLISSEVPGVPTGSPGNEPASCVGAPAELWRGES